MEVVGELLLGGWNLIKMGFTALGDFFKSLNAQGVVGLLVAIGLGVLCFHYWADDRHWKKQDARDVKALQVEQKAAQILASEAVAMKAKTDAQSSAISEKNKELNDATNARIDADANAARVRGPGRAVCPGLPASTGGHVAPGGTGPAGVVQLPDSGGSELVALPFDDAVSVIQQCALNRNEALTWRLNDQQQRQAWPKH